MRKSRSLCSGFCYVAFTSAAVFVTTARQPIGTKSPTQLPRVAGRLHEFTAIVTVTGGGPNPPGNSSAHFRCGPWV